MQPSYPLPSKMKRELRGKAMKTIRKWIRKAIAVIVTHYHYDHHFLPGDQDLPEIKIWQSRLLILKNPNMYINESQWHRARLFVSRIMELAGENVKEYLIQPLQLDFPDLVEKLEIALSKNFGEYNKRRKELLNKGKHWFIKLAKKLWSVKPWIKEVKLQDRTGIVWADGKTFRFGDTEIKVLEPWFHGVEYDRTGWIIPLIIRKKNITVFYSSDVMGPIIEDYVAYISKFKPDIIILDGPPTYLYPYMLNRINMLRAIENAKTIMDLKPKLVIYDHHLLREKKWRQKVREVFKAAEKNDVKIMTAAEYLGEKPLIDKICEENK